MAKTYKSCFLPNLFASQPNKQFPTKPPKQNTETIHESSSVVNGPLSNGVDSDSKTKKLELGHPHPAPNATINKFADIKNRSVRKSMK